MKFRLGVLSLWFFVCSGLARDCGWDRSIDADQGLDLGSEGVRVLQRGGLAEVSDPESCRAACCNEPQCDLALVGYPADGEPQCQLVSCGGPGRDACVLRPSSQFKVYRRNEKDRGAKPHIAPLQGPWEPRTNETNNIRCRLPMKVGSCRAAFPRFYYNVTNQSCHSFVYGGCKGNANNFNSQEDCEATCSGVTGSVLPDESTPAPPQAPSFNTNVSEDAEGLVAATESVQRQESGMSADEYAESCQVEPQVGPCRAAHQRWYYNSSTGNCESFIFGGCRGNNNNYISKKKCMDTCTVLVLPSSKKSSADEEYKRQCMATPDPGPCRAAFTMFFYDHNTDTCQSFIFGGCSGNQNRYDSMDECMRRCSQGGSFESRGKTRNIWFPVTLSALSALLLVTLVLISLKRHRLSRHSSSTSDKEELLPDPDEQSSVESLSIPGSPTPDKA